MTERTQTVMTDRARTPHIIDTKGLAVALIFLTAIAIWAGEPADKALQPPTMWKKQPDLAVHVEIRKISLAEDTAQHVIGSPRFAGEEQIHVQS
jgi:hypothetical protein